MMAKEHERRARSLETTAEELVKLAGQSIALARQVARNPGAPENLLRELGSHKDKTVRKWVTVHPGTPPDVLLKLAQQFPEQLLDNPVLDLLMLENPNLFEDMPIGTVRSLMKREKTPVGFIRFAAGLKDEGVQLAIAQNRSTPVEIIKQLASTGLTKEIRYAAKAWNEAEPDIELAEAKFWVEMSRRLASLPPKNPALSEFHALIRARGKDLVMIDNAEWIKGMLLARRSKVSGHKLVDLSKHPFALIHTELVGRKDLPVQAQIELAKSSVSRIRKVLAKRRSSTPEVLEILAYSDDLKVRLIAIKNPRVELAVLHSLSKDDNEQIRCAVAQNQNTPAEILERLAVDEDPGIRSAVAEHSSAPTLLLECLASDHSDSVRWNVAKNPNTTVAALKMMAEDKSVIVRSSLAENQNTPMDILDQLASEKKFYLGIPRAVARNPSTSPGTLERLANDKDSWIRRYVGGNPNTKISTLERLAHDEDAWVRWHVAKNPNASSQVLKHLAKDKDYMNCKAATEALILRTTKS